MHIFLFALYSLLATVYISLYSLNSPRDVEDVEYLKLAVVVNSVCVVMKLVLFMVDILMLVMFGKFNNSFDEEFD